MDHQVMKVLIADDMDMIRRRYIKIMEEDPSIVIVGEADTKASAVEAALLHKPDVILMDIDMDTKTAGLDATNEILSALSDTKIVILTVCENDENVFSAFQYGVSDYILKNSNSNELIACVKAAYYNRSPIRPVIAEKIRMEFQRIKSKETSFLYCLQMVSQLTQTEIDILDLLNKDYTRQQICSIRHVELSTVKTQIHNILKKFEMKSIVSVLSFLNEMKIFEYLHKFAR